MTDMFRLFASITGAWIETIYAPISDPTKGFASITGAWIETSAGKSAVYYKELRVHHGRVD